MELYRVEAVEIAINKGINARWSFDHITAHGMAGQRNPLGNALTHLEASITTLPNGAVSYSGGAFHLAHFLLSGELIRMKICSSKNATDFAEWGLRFFIDKKCPACRGTGVINIEQETCQMCGGKKTKPASPIVEQTYKVILSYLDWMESQLSKKLRGYLDY